ncbi:glycosyltransferase family 2 protein [Thomasclavelia sp.]|uniref:glycosyltransferase family 2 protein n=1 Tax=Thomasclavelia sp. TaxID=3025757 RepID=UPI0025CDCCAA|nr:glycosyltransferase family 2 protein [Thomasclavelia sp.]
MFDLVSVIVPVYNVSKYLDRCINSIVNQIYSNIEIILVDDGSTDDSGTKCDIWKRRDERIKVIHKNNGGLSDARNHGILKASGNYICFVDSDDWIEPKYIQILLHDLINYNADVSVCGKKYIYPTYTNIWDKSKKIRVMNKYEAIARMNDFYEYNMSSCDKMFKTELFQNIKFPIGKKCEDFYIMSQLFMECTKIVYNPTPLYNYFQRDGSITHSSTFNDDFIIAAYKQMRYLEQFEQIKNVGEVYYAFSLLTKINFLLCNKYTEYEYEILKKEACTYKKNVNRNKYIKLRKKIQFNIFCFSSKLYKLLYLLLKRSINE